MALLPGSKIGGRSCHATSLQCALGGMKPSALWAARPAMSRGFSRAGAAKPSVFAEHSKRFAENVVRYHEHARDNHLYLLMPSCRRRSIARSPRKQLTRRCMPAWSRKLMPASCSYAAAGHGRFTSDAVFISCIHPMQPGDEAYRSRLLSCQRARPEDLCPPVLRQARPRASIIRCRPLRRGRRAHCAR
jgi:hypothetical protein